MDSGRDDSNNDLMANSNNTKDILSIRVKEFCTSSKKVCRWLLNISINEALVKITTKN